MTLSIGLFGFGKAGSVVANEIINDQDCELKWVLRKSPKSEGEFASHLLGNEHEQGKIYSIKHVDFNSFYQEHRVDVIIDFSVASAIDEYSKAGSCGIRIVSAISEYRDNEFARLTELSRQTAVLYSPNITFGVNFLIEASKLLKRIAPHADIEIIEEHFRDKKSVSGTALKIAENLGLDKKKHINSIRVGGIVGKHEVVFGLPNQTIRIIHESLNRAAFGQGAIYAAKWIMKQEQGIYSMEQALSLVNRNDYLSGEQPA